MSKLTSAQWSTFWTRSTVTTVGTMFENNYDGAVAEFWHLVLAGRPATVLDLACGNGALAWLANEFLNGESQSCRVIGVDAAIIKPFEVLGRDPKKYPCIEFLGNTPIESLPFESRSIDVAISQYGLEYSELSASIPEIARVLKADGVMAFIVHGEESTLVRSSTRHLAEHKMVLRDIRIHERFAQLDGMIGKSKDLRKIAGKPAVRKLMAAIDADSEKIHAIMAAVDPPFEIQRYCGPMFEAFTEDAVSRGVNRKKIMRHCYAGLKAYIERIEDLLSATLSQSEQDGLVKLIEMQGLTVTHRAPVSYEQSPNIGTAILAKACQ